MKNIPRLLKSPTLRKYVAVGGATFLTELVIIFICTHVLNLPSFVAVTISFWTGLVLSFVLQKILTFGNKNKSPKHLLWQSVSYGSLVIVNYLFTIGFVALFDSLIGVYLARTAALIITTIWNYVIYQKAIFSDTPPLTKTHIRHLSIIVLLTLPIIVMCLPMLLSGATSIFSGDFDMQIQMTEAARTSIVHYNQFPLWNPWVSGGVPLFADPQFNLISPATLLSLFIPTPIAWKITIFLYMVIGFFSMRKLLHHLINNAVVASLFSYIWVFGSFFILRAIGGHFTFLNLLLIPLFIYLVLTLTKNWRKPLYLTLITCYMLYASIHYATIFTVLIVGALSIYVMARYVWKREWKTLTTFMKYLVGSIVAAIILALPRIVSTVEYLGTNRIIREDAPEVFISWRSGIEAIITPYQHFSLPHSSFGPFEASNYIGIITVLLVACTTIIVSFLALKRRNKLPPFSYIVFFFVAMGIAGFIIGVGGAPFNELHKLPLFSTMRVSTRFFFITSLALIIIGSMCVAHLMTYKSKYNRIYNYILLCILALATIQVFYWAFTLNMKVWPQTKAIPATDTAQTTAPRSEKRWNADTNHPYVNHALTQATLNNRAQVYADNALINTDILPTALCDEDENGCRFVLTNNAVVTEWTPNRIKLQRTGGGTIRLNMNSGRKWTVNGNYIFRDQDTVDSINLFMIESTDTQFTLQYHL